MAEVAGAGLGGRIGHDRRLVERARRGDAEAFDEIVRSRNTVQYRTAVAILGSEADARDAVQDAFLAAWRDLPRLRDADRFDAWLGRIVVNACRMTLRRRRGRWVREIPIDDGEQAETSAARTRQGADAEEIDVIERAFDRLSADHRIVIVLHHLRGRSLEEIATDLGIPLGTVKSRHHHARRALAAALEAERR